VSTSALHTVAIAQPTLALAIPALAVAAIGAALRPTPFVVALLLVIGFPNTLAAYTPITPNMVNTIVDALLVTLLLGAIGRYAYGPRRPVKLWPGMLPLALYVTVTAIYILTTTPISLGVRSFSQSAWFMLVLFVFALAPWPRETLFRIAQGALVVGALVGGYALFRYAIGPSGAELAVARAASGGIGQDVRFFGSFPLAQHLALWCALMVPFGLAVALNWPGRWRLLGVFVTATSSFAVVATSVRSGLVGAVLGAVAVLLLSIMTQAAPSGRRVATGLLGALGVLVIGVGAYGLAVSGSPEARERLSGILSPGDVGSYQSRLERWDPVLEEIMKEPLGHGLGTLGAVGNNVNPEIGAALDYTTRVDNSYLKVGFEQGYLAMVLFVVALLALLGGLGVRATSMTDPRAAALVIAGCGALAAILVPLYLGMYVERLQVIVAWAVAGLGVAQLTMARVRATRTAPGKPPSRAGPAHVPGAPPSERQPALIPR